ncbi:MAG: RtcB family protein [Candidatus Moraniibacteriota bacterium]
MKQVISTERVPIKMWLGEIEQGALDQAKNLANLPFVFKHVAIMPDSHVGYGMPIGGVLATENVVIPNAVGVDIGCGMCAVKTSLTEVDQDTLKKLMGEIRKKVPVGFAHQKEKQDQRLMPDRNQVFNMGEICQRENENALSQIGTLGGGNHFIEIQKGNDGHIWVMIHSGSRNLGLQVATHYNKLAEILCDKFYSSVPKSQQLAFLPLDIKEGQDYLLEMKYCVEFALANRQLMMNNIIDSFKEVTGFKLTDENEFVMQFVNIAHNYAALENHFGKNVVVHRKGATKATEGLVGIIPGSMGTKSYIVEGLGNKESFMSCSHGAGRKMGRKQAIATLNLAEEQAKMENVLGKPRNQDDLQEAPGAYKDIDVVMENQKDLVKILVELKPLAVIKG